MHTIPYHSIWEVSVLVYGIMNRMLYRGFHQSAGGKKTIVKPDGKAVKGDWLHGSLAIVPMPVPEGAAPQMPILCLHSPERWNGRVGEQSVCPGTLSLFSGTWMDTDWDALPKAVQREWLARKKTSADWQGIPVFEGDIFWHKGQKAYFTAVYDQLRGFRLENAETGETGISWFFGEMRKKGDVWVPPKDFPAARLARFHAARKADARVETVRF